MPTGYTSDIVEGKVTTFKEFARVCMRAFGATIHMRDERLSEPYRPRKVESYYTDSVKEAEEKLEKIKKADDNFFIDKIRKDLKKDYAYYKEQAEKKKRTKERLEKILSEAKEWNPPTSDHMEAKKFMLSQLEETLKYDGDYSYYEKEMDDIMIQLESPIDVSSLRAEMIREAEDDLKKAKERLEEEIERCKDSNEWASKFLESIK
jgi:hypothetical protein